MTKRTLLTISAIVVLLCSRGALVMVSRGSNDLRTWKIYSEHVARYGVVSAYPRFKTFGPVESIFNHGPIAAAIGSYARRVRFPFGTFYSSFRMLCLLGSVAAITAIGALSAQPMLSLLLYILSPVALLIEGFHGNTDPVAAGLLMVGVLVGLRPSGALLRGFCFGLAILAKPIAVIAAIPLVAVGLREKTFVRTSVGWALGLLPLLVTHILEPQSVLNIWTYRSSPEPWGMRFLSRDWEPLRSSSLPCLLLPCLYSWGVARGWLKASLPEALAAVWLIFLLFAPGIGVQYFIYPLAPLLIAAPILGGAYGLITSIFVSVVYLTFLERDPSGVAIMPFSTSHEPMKEYDSIVLCAKLTWACLVVLTLALLRGQLRRGQQSWSASTSIDDARPEVNAPAMRVP